MVFDKLNKSSYGKILSLNLKVVLMIAFQKLFDVNRPFAIYSM